MPPNTVKVDRSTKWGNPFKPCEGRSQWDMWGAFKQWLELEHCHAGIPETKARMVAEIGELRGKNLACWCKLGTPCHADVLLELANK